jgi:superfamily I DNA/RNA helicase
MTPMIALELTFQQQLTLMLIEKLGIGIIVVVAVLVSQWMIERYKARRGVWTEISKERVKHIADDWNEMNKWDGIVGDLYAKLQSILEKNLKTNRPPSMGRPELTETISFLSQLNLSKIAEGLTEQCKQELKPLIQKSEEQSDVVAKTLLENRFWLGKELYEHCRDYQKTLHKICVSFGNMDFKDLAVLACELNQRREDVLTTLARVK